MHSLAAVSDTQNLENLGEGKTHNHASLNAARNSSRSFLPRSLKKSLISVLGSFPMRMYVMWPLGTHSLSFCFPWCHEYSVGVPEHPVLVRRSKALISFAVIMLSFSVACSARIVGGLLAVDHQGILFLHLRIKANNAREWRRERDGRAFRLGEVILHFNLDDGFFPWEWIINIRSSEHHTPLKYKPCLFHVFFFLTGFTFVYLSLEFPARRVPRKSDFGANEHIIVEPSNSGLVARHQTSDRAKLLKIWQRVE